MSDEVEIDDYVQPGTPLVSLEDRSKVEVRFSLRLREVRWLWGVNRTTIRNNYELPEVDVQVYLDLDGHQYKWTARLARYDGAGFDPGTRTVPCIAVVDNPSDGQLVVDPSQRANVTDLPIPPTLLRGLFVSLKIPVSSKLDLVQIPSVSLRPGNKVWVADGDTLDIKDVAVAHAGEDNVILFSGPDELRAGDRVITSPMPLLVNGMNIRESGSETLPSSDSDVNAEAL
ncbi:efflux RND transporter periplasmic adaptor subunit [Planctomycetota bacterium]